MSTFSYFGLPRTNTARRWARYLLFRLGRRARKLSIGNRHGIRARLMGGFIGVASLTLVASVVAFFSYN